MAWHVWNLGWSGPDRCEECSLWSVRKQVWFGEGEKNKKNKKNNIRHEKRVMATKTTDIKK